MRRGAGEGEGVAFGLADDAIRPLGAERELQHLAELGPVGDRVNEDLRGTHPLSVDAVVIERLSNANAPVI